MSKAKETKEKIYKQTAKPFNHHGYPVSSFSEIMCVRNARNNFQYIKSKQELAFELFEECISITEDTLL